MRRALLLLLWPLVALSQKPALEIKIDSISSFDMQSAERKYTLFFHLHNPAKKPVSILLKPTHLSSIQYGSLSNSVHYKIYEEDKALDLGDAFDRTDVANTKRIRIDTSDPDKIAASKKMLRENFTMTEAQIDEYIKSGKLNDSTIKFRKREILSEVLTLKPGETQSFSHVFFWDKQPYFKYDENEFYLDVKRPHYIELLVISMREPFKSQMSAEDFAKLEATPNFATGVFVSNRVLIDFSE